MSVALARSMALALVMVAPATSSAQPGPITLDGAPHQAGERCGANGGCITGLECIRGVCSDPKAPQPCKGEEDCYSPLLCIAGFCTDPAHRASTPQGAATQATTPQPSASKPPPPPPPRDADHEEGSSSGSSEWERFDLDDTTHGFIGLLGGGGFTVPYSPQAGVAFDLTPAALIALRGGALFGTTELALEVSPVTYWVSVETRSWLAFNVSIGELARLDDNWFWPVRVGAGAIVVDGASKAEVLFLPRLDLIGVAANFGHVLFDVSLPSFRIATEFEEVVAFTWVGTLGVSYVL